MSERKSVFGNGKTIFSRVNWWLEMNFIKRRNSPGVALLMGGEVEGVRRGEMREKRNEFVSDNNEFVREYFVFVSF
jgi:hypothetical protein